MSGNEKKARTIDFNKAKIVSTYQDLTKSISENNDVISRLTRRLQTSLDSDNILRMFAEEVEALVKFDQFVFEAEDKTQFKIGNKAGTHSCLYNMNLDNSTLGSIKFSRKSRFMEEELAIIERLASTLVFPLRNAKMYQAALHSALRDELTGCGNKRALDACLHREADLSVRHNRPLSVIMLDADHFKQINDTFGHLAGDMVLRELASTVKRWARQSDLCFRYGGEEFLLILNDSDSIQALKIAERIRKAVEEHVFTFNNTLIPVTISLGSATLESGEQLDSFKDRADQALYIAKQNGRNVAVSHELNANSRNMQFAQSL